MPIFHTEVHLDLRAAKSAKAMENMISNAMKEENMLWYEEHPDGTLTATPATQAKIARFTQANGNIIGGDGIETADMGSAAPTRGAISSTHPRTQGQASGNVAKGTAPPSRRTRTLEAATPDSRRDRINSAASLHGNRRPLSSSPPRRAHKNQASTSFSRAPTSKATTLSSEPTSFTTMCGLPLRRAQPSREARDGGYRARGVEPPSDPRNRTQVRESGSYNPGTSFYSSPFLPPANTSEVRHSPMTSGGSGVFRGSQRDPPVVAGLRPGIVQSSSTPDSSGYHPSSFNLFGGPAVSVTASNPFPDVSYGNTPSECHSSTIGVFGATTSAVGCHPSPHVGNGNTASGRHSSSIGLFRNANSSADDCHRFLHVASGNAPPPRHYSSIGPFGNAASYAAGCQPSSKVSNFNEPGNAQYSGSASPLAPSHIAFANRHIPLQHGSADGAVSSKSTMSPSDEQSSTINEPNPSSPLANMRTGTNQPKPTLSAYSPATNNARSSKGPSAPKVDFRPIQEFKSPNQRKHRAPMVQIKPHRFEDMMIPDLELATARALQAKVEQAAKQQSADNATKLSEIADTSAHTSTAYGDATDESDRLHDIRGAKRQKLEEKKGSRWVRGWRGML